MMAILTVVRLLLLFSHVWLCSHMDCSMPGFPVFNHLQQFVQTHIHWVGDAIQPSHPLSSPFPCAFNLSQYHGVCQWIGSLHSLALHQSMSASASVLPMNIQDWFPLGFPGLISLLSKGLSRVFCSTTVIQKHRIISARCSVVFMVQLHSHLYTTGKTIALTMWTFVSKLMSLLFNMLSRFLLLSCQEVNVF